MKTTQEAKEEATQVGKRMIAVFKEEATHEGKRTTAVFKEEYKMKLIEFLRDNELLYS